MLVHLAWLQLVKFAVGSASIGASWVVPAASVAEVTAS